MRLKVIGDLLQIVEANDLEVKQLYAEATAEVPNFVAAAVNKRKGRKTDWNGQICYVFNGVYLPFGLWKRIWDLQLRKPIPYEVKIEGLIDNFDRIVSLEELEQWAECLDMPFDMRDDQLKFILTACKFKKSCLRLATSYGKTALVYVISRFLKDSKRINGKTLMIVPSVHLVSQAFDDIVVNYQQNESDLANKNYKLYKIHSGVRNEYKIQDADMIVGTYQSLVNMPADFFEQFDFIVTDEAHGAPAASIREIFSHCTKAHYRLGVSGSLPLEHTAARLTIESYIGPILGTFGVAQALKKNIVSDFEIKRVVIEHSAKYDAPFVQYLEEHPEVFDNTARLLPAEQHHCMHYVDANKLIAKIICSLDKNALVLCKRRDHVQNIYDACQTFIQQSGVDKVVHIIRGDVPLHERKDMLAMMEAEPDRHIMIATTGTLSTGVSVHAWFYAAFLMIGKSDNVTLQSIGRLLRKHPLKQKAIILDIAHKLTIHSDMLVKLRKGYCYCNYDMQHFAARKQIYDAEKMPVDAKVQKFKL